MQTPIEIDAQGAPLSDELHRSILAHVTGLEKRFGRITGCRVAVRAPTARHLTGGLCGVRVHLALPDKREITVDRTADADERFADASFAINDAFRRVRRRLNDQVRRMQQRTKAHEAQPLATVSRLNREAGFGFLQASDGHEVYFHRNSVLDGAFHRLEPGMRVAFVEEPGDKGPQASTVRIAGRHGMR
jgi:cold shock CspA family protein